MAEEVIRRQGSATDHGSFTGAAGEITVENTNWNLRIHDGATAGGHTTLMDSDFATTAQHEAATATDLVANPAGVKAYVDIESGTWTPVLEGGNEAGSHTYSTQSGAFIRRGGLCYVEVSVALSSKDTSADGSLIITGLPFPVAGNARPNAVPGFVTGVDSVSSSFCGFVLRGETSPASIVFRQSLTDGGFTSFSIGSISDSFSVRFGLTYRIN